MNSNPNPSTFQRCVLGQATQEGGTDSINTHVRMHVHAHTHTHLHVHYMLICSEHCASRQDPIKTCLDYRELSSPWSHPLPRTARFQWLGGTTTPTYSFQPRTMLKNHLNFRASCGWAGASAGPAPHPNLPSSPIPAWGLIPRASPNKHPIWESPSLSSLSWEPNHIVHQEIRRRGSKLWRVHNTVWFALFPRLSKIQIWGEKKNR